MPYPFTFDASPDTIVPGGYCKASDVVSMFKQIQLLSTLTDDEIEKRVGDAAVEMDAVLSTLYVTPVSGDATALGILRLVNMRLAGAVIHEVLRHRTGKQEAGAESWRTWAEGMLLDVVNGHIHFFTAPVQSPSELPQFPRGAGATFNPDNDMDLERGQGPIFSRTDRPDVTSLGNLM